MASEHSILCPLCGNKVPPGLTRCPVCATDLQRVVAKLNVETKSSPEFMSKDLPKVGLPKPKSECPQCGLDLAGGESKCPRCGIPLSTEESMTECPECGALSPKDSKSCGRCGNSLNEVRVPPPPRPIAPPRPPPLPVATTPAPTPKPQMAEPSARPQPVVPEKVTPPPASAPRAEPARPREVPVKGAAQMRQSGQGLINGRGAINGTGLVNGTGITNGARADIGAKPSSKRRVVTRWQFLALLIALIVIIPTFMYVSYPRDSGPITIDGDFDDWSAIARFNMRQNSASASTNVSGWTVETDSTELFLYVATRADTMSSSAIDSFYAFVDSDADATTGYLVSGIGANYLVKVIGWNGSVTSSSVSSFMPSSGDQRDWNGWLESSPAQAGLAGDEIEVAANIPGLSSGARYVLASQTGESPQGISFVVHEDTPILIVHQEPSATMADGVIAKSGSTPAMVVSLSCQGGSGTVTELVPTVSGANGIQGQAGTIDLSPGEEPYTLTINVDTSGSATGAAISVSIPLSGITTSFESVAVTGDTVRAYVASPPASIQIDGAFGDWVGLTAPDTDATEVKDPNIDISAVGAVNTSASSSFYVSVAGEICHGSFVPSHLTKPSGSGGGSVTPTKKVGEDILQVYIDTDELVSTGSVVIHPSKTIGADFMIELRGLDGEITSRSIMKYVSGSWTYVGGTVLAAHDEQQIELSIASSSISMASSIDFIIETTDWRAWSDLATAVPQGTRGVDGSDFGTRAWIVDNSINSALATATSNQRKLFHDSANFWSVYVDGGNTIAAYSADGMTWVSDGRVFKTNGVLRTSIWYDAASQAVYAVGDRTAWTTNVYLQKGTVSPSTHTIAWSAADRVLAVSTYGLASKNTFISRDAAGYIWLMTVNCTTLAPAAYDLSAFKSNTADTVSGVWTATGSLVSASAQSTLKGCIVPAGTGSNMWAVYVYSGTVASKKYTGTWGGQNILSTATGIGGNTDNAPPSAVVDSRGVIHVVYGDDHEHPTGTSMPHIYYRYNAGSAWSAPLPLSSEATIEGFGYPTISLDTSTGNVYAFWYDMQTQYVAAKRNVSGTWSALTLNAQTADAKAYLTSIYSATSPFLICYMWTQNTTAPIHVVFDRIPEFSDTALPVIGMVAVLIFAIGPTRRRKRPE